MLRAGYRCLNATFLRCHSSTVIHPTYSGIHEYSSWKAKEVYRTETWSSATHIHIYIYLRIFLSREGTLRCLGVLDNWIFSWKPSWTTGCRNHVISSKHIRENSLGAQIFNFNLYSHGDTRLVQKRCDPYAHYKLPSPQFTSEVLFLVLRIYLQIISALFMHYRNSQLSCTMRKSAITTLRPQPPWKCPRFVFYIPACGSHI